MWIVTTSLAWRRAMKSRFTEHRAWMIRSFALTLAAVTLRLYLPLAAIMSIPFDNAYRAISFLAWVPNPSNPKSDRGNVVNAISSPPLQLFIRGPMQIKRLLLRKRL